MSLAAASVVCSVRPALPPAVLYGSESHVAQAAVTQRAESAGLGPGMGRGWDGDGDELRCQASWFCPAGPPLWSHPLATTAGHGRHTVTDHRTTVRASTRCTCTVLPVAAVRGGYANVRNMFCIDVCRLNGIIKKKLPFYVRGEISTRLRHEDLSPLEGSTEIVSLCIYL